MRVVILLFALLLVACGGGEVSPESEVLPERPDFETNYTVLTSESRLGISSTQEGAAFDGAFADFDAMIRFDADALNTSRVWVSVPIDSLDAGSADRNNTARGADWLNVRETPRGIFESGSIRLSEDGYVADGTLTLRGTSLPFSLPFALEQTEDRAVMTATVPLERLRWGIGQDWNSGDYVGLTVTLDIRVVAERTG